MHDDDSPGVPAAPEGKENLSGFERASQEIERASQEVPLDDALPAGG